MILLILTLKCRTLLYMSKDTALSTFQSAATQVLQYLESTKS